MQIAIIGNINNAPFFLGEGLRSWGVNVRLLVTRAERLHHPVLAGLVETLPDWVYDASSIGLEAFERQTPAIGPALGFVMFQADLAILNDTGPSLHNLLPVPVVTNLTGSDLTYYATLSSGPARRSNWAPGFVSAPQGLMDMADWEQLVIRQRAGIRRSILVHHAWRGVMPENDAILDEIGVEDSRRVCLINMDIDRVQPAPLPEGQPLKIFNGARLNWVEPMPPGFSHQDHKGTDQLLRGFRAFLQRGGQGQLTLVEKGLHVAETRALALELGIDRHIIWKPEMTMAQFNAEIAAANLVCCNLGKSVPGQAALTGMVAGRPVLANFRAYADHLPEPWPVCDAQTADEVAQNLWTLYADPDRRIRMGAAARRFAENYLSPRGAAKMLLDRLSVALPVYRLETQIRRLEAECGDLRGQV